MKQIVIFLFLILVNFSGNCQEFEDLFGLFGFEVDTAVAHRLAEVVVPVGPVDGIARVKVHRIRHLRQIIIGSGHESRLQLPVDVVFA